MVLVLRAVGARTAFLGQQMSSFAPIQTSIKKASVSAFSHFSSINEKSFSPSFTPCLLSRVSIPKSSYQSQQLRLFSSNNGVDAIDVGVLHFPKKDVIVEYLTKHPLTRDRLYTEKKIINAMANFFSGEHKVEAGVDTGVMLSLYDLNEELKLPPATLKVIEMNLAVALKDCANGKPILDI